MSAAFEAPPDFEVRTRGVACLIARAGTLAALDREGLGDAETWDRLCPRDPPVVGRGATSRVEVRGVGSLRVKRLRRGGLAGPLWRDRFAGRRRILDNLLVPLAARRLGIPTPDPLALLLIAGPAGLYRGWLALEEVAGARSLAEALGPVDPVGLAAIDAVVGAIRGMHDRGLEHRDLNLGNLLVRARPDGTTEPFVIDLDRARVHGRALSFARRQRALRRLERSTVKTLGPGFRVEGVELCRRWYESYAAGDAALAVRLERVRGRNRWRIALHRIGWGRP